MKYTIIVRAFFNIKRKDKNAAHAARLFPDLPVCIVGKYWKDDSLWEAAIHHECEYADDKTALWETLTYVAPVASNWNITFGLNDPSLDTVLTAVTENRDNTGLTWCNFELLRGSLHDKGK